MAITDNLVSWYRCDEASGNLLDSWGSNDLTDNNTVGIGTGVINGARDFVLANSEYAQITSALMPYSDWSISFWAAPDSISSASTQIAINHGADNGWVAAKRGYAIGRRGDGGASTDAIIILIQQVAWFDSGAKWSGAGTFDHIVVTRTSGNLTTLYKNGSAAPNTSSAEWLGENIGDNFSVGAEYVQTGPSTTRYWDGLVDLIGCWTRVITGAEITSLYNGGAGYDPTASAPSGYGPLVGRSRLLRTNLTNSHLVAA